MDRLSKIPTPLLLLITIIPLAITCSSNKTEVDKDHIANVNEWHAERIAALEERDGWMSLVGLHKLEDGTLSFGSDSTNTIVFPPQAPAVMGTIEKQGKSIKTISSPDVEILNDSTVITEINMTIGEDQDEATVLRHEALLWYVIERRGDHWIRLKDTQHPNFEGFDGIERFPISKNWKVKANFKPFEEPKKLLVPDVLDVGKEETIYGSLEFEIDGKQHSILPINHPEKDEKFFIVFGDKTNGKSTYGGGRYVYIPTPDENGTTYIDFNKSYNPPCVFTKYATCPLPPPQNRLSVEIPAGEKMYGDKKSY